MNKARAFFYVCAGLFLLAGAYHLGARSATAQATADPVTAAVMQTGGFIFVFTASGEVYGGLPGDVPWTRWGNVFGGTVPTQGTSWGQLKAKYRDTASPQPQGEK